MSSTFSQQKDTAAEIHRQERQREHINVEKKIFSGHLDFPEQYKAHLGQQTVHGVDFGSLWFYSHPLARVPMALVFLSQVLQAGTAVLRIKLTKTNILKKDLFF